MSNKNIEKKIGIFGGSFDPPHRGHIQIARLSLKKLKLKYLIWAITKRNPLKEKPMLSLKMYFHWKPTKIGENIIGNIIIVLNVLWPHVILFINNAIPSPNNNSKFKTTAKNKIVLPKAYQNLVLSINLS